MSSSVAAPVSPAWTLRPPDGSIARLLAARWTPLVIAVLAGVLFGWHLTVAGFAGPYATTVKSMSSSWRAFVFGAFDPGATITLDKLAGSLIPQALAVRLFGFHQWALALPQVIEGALAVPVLHRAVRRWAGPGAGALAAVIFALTPVVVSMFGHAVEDAALTLCLVLAADRYQAAVTTGRLRSLVAAGVWVGVAFQCKMLQAWMVLPAFAVGYLLASPVSRRRRLGHLGVAGAATLAVSLCWIVLYSVVPPAERPYVDGSTDNSAWAMVFGYNGLGRFGLHLPGALAFPDIPGPLTLGPTRAATWTQLVNDPYVTQVGWLYPLALVALLSGLWGHRRAGRTDPHRAGYVSWGGWLATGVLVFSLMRMPHSTYVAFLAPPLSALSAAGLASAFGQYRRAGRTWPVLGVAAVQAGWMLYLWRPYRWFFGWFPYTAVAVAVGAVLLSAAPALVRFAGRVVRRNRSEPAGSGTPRSRLAGGVTRLGVVLAVLSVLAAPSAWGLSGLDPRFDGDPVNAGTGPSASYVLATEEPASYAGRCASTPPPAPASQDDRRGAILPVQRRDGGVRIVGDNNVLDPVQCQMLAYTQRNNPPGAYAFATDIWSAASPYIGAAGANVLPMGGYYNSTPQPTLPALRQLIATGKLRFVLLTRGTLPGMPPWRSAPRQPGASVTTVEAIREWVRASCTLVPTTTYAPIPVPAIRREPAITPKTPTDVPLAGMLGRLRPALPAEEGFPRTARISDAGAGLYRCAPPPAHR
ncbi:MAG TPA: glycosyltransferase family 39 protein [Pseudonocardia sp.]|uniref:ArnT family glycosyltransferase n=1 Tax=Pseudonocardia sp. TaxID=60912 RepID=UPI002F3F010B